ncbi:MAG: amidohydrolase family protein [Reyranellaceae bacterium]
MGKPLSLAIRGGEIVDGSGQPAFRADVGVRDGVIVAVGSSVERAETEIDARGCLVTPGFIDVHTHYDAQVTWSNHIAPSSFNGVTTVLMGNCGVGFAPCNPEHREMLVEFMEGVEDIPRAVLKDGLPWSWRTFPEFLDFLSHRQFDLDVCAMLTHSALRLYVMGQRAIDQAPSDAADRGIMTKLVAESVQAGGFGVSTARALHHKSLDGRPVPALAADEDELLALAEGLRRGGAGWMQLIPNFEHPDAEFEMLKRLTRRSGRPLSLSLLQRDNRPDSWRETLRDIDAVNEQGLPISAQIATRAVGLIFGFELSQHPFMLRPSYKKIASLPFEERLASLRQPEFRDRLLAEETPASQHERLHAWDRTFPWGEFPDYEPPPEASIAFMAKRRGVSPERLAYDHLLQDEGRGLLMRPKNNFDKGRLDAVETMLEDRNSIVGLGDGGAHAAYICDSSSLPFMLTHWVRDRPNHNPKFTVEWAVKRITSDNAKVLGLFDRGIVAPGFKADMNVIDYDKLRLRKPYIVYDLPAGGRRLLQKCDGIMATILTGVPVYREGALTGKIPGRLVRGMQPAPIGMASSAA